MKLERTDHPKYRWKVVSDYSVLLNAMIGHRGLCSIVGRDGQPYVQLFNDELTLFEGYHFDGCTLAPDFNDALVGCCVHDALLQILELYPDAYDEQRAHDALHEVQSSAGFPLAWLYHWAVSSWPRQLYKLLLCKLQTRTKK